MKVEQISISKLKPAPYNPRTLSDDRRKDLQRSLDEFGLVEPLVWNKQTGHVVAGNQRLMLLKESGRKKIDCAVVDLPLDREKLLNLRLNKTSGEWDAPKLSEILKELDPGDWSLTGFDDIDIEPLVFDAQIVEDEIPEPPKKAITKPGDLWQLGEHRVLCGDATKAEDVARLLDGREPFIMVTDPPYGMNYTGTVHKKHAQPGFSPSQNRAVPLIVGDKSVFDPMPAVELSGCREVFIWGGDWFYDRLPSGGSWIVWDKRASEAADSTPGSPFEVCWSMQRHAREFIRIPWGGWNKTEDGKRWHPTQKPVECMARPIRNHGGKDDDVYDPFLGSGTTLIAAEQLGRNCYGLEIEPKYCDVIVERWQNLTNKKAKRA